MNNIFSRLLVAAFFLALLGSSKAFAVNTQITVGAGTWDNQKWNAYVHLPSSYAANPNKYYPTILFFPGLGEVGTINNNVMSTSNASAVISNGPGAYIASGWNGNVTTSDGAVHEFIVISLQTPAYPAPWTVKQKIDQIKSMYRIDPDRFHFTGLSHGGWVSNMTATYKPSYYDTDYLDLAASIVNVEGVSPGGTGNLAEGVTASYPQNFIEYAQRGGKELGFEQTNDGRDIPTIINAMNTTTPNSSFFALTHFGGGTHCCWSNFYGGGGTTPSTTFPNSTGVTQPIQGVPQTIYQWMARQIRHAAPIAGGATVSNYPPRVDAGTDIVVTWPNTYPVLSGSAVDPEGGGIANYTWSQILGPNGSSFVTNNSSTANHTGVFTSGPGIYVYRLTATDSGGASNYDDVVVQQRGPINNAPVVNAGADQYIATGGAVVPIVSISDSDPAGHPLYYRWDLMSTPGPWASMNPNPHIAAPTFTGFTKTGDYRFRLTVTDVFGLSATDEMIVHVGSTVNLSPVANAGSDQTISLPTTTTTLTSQSTDSDGDITTYGWTQVSGPNTATITSPSATSTSVTGLVQGSYTFRLTVTDDDGGTAQDVVTITVTSPLSTGGIILNYKLDTLTTDWNAPTEEIRTITGGAGDAVGLTSSNVISGKLAQALTFPSNGYITIPNAWNFSKYFDVNPATGTTLSLWARFSTTPSGNTLVSQGVNGTILRIVANANSTITATLNGASVTSPTLSPSVLVNSWVHIAVVYKGNQQTLYITGMPQAVVTITTATQPLLPIIVGGTSNGSTVTASLGTHSLDDIRLYNRGLTQNEIQSIVSGTDNEPPSVNAGPDRLNADTSVSVAATVSDKENAIRWMTWRGWDIADTSGNPSYTVSFANPQALSTEAIGLTVGHTYRLQFIVEDDKGQQAGDSLLVTVTQSSGRPATFAVSEASNTLFIPAGDYPDGILVENAIGTSARPFTIINKGGVVTASSLILNDAQYATLSGSGSADRFGFRIYGGNNVDTGIAVTGKSFGDTIEQVSIEGVDTGISIVPQVSADASENYPEFSVNNLVIKDNQISGTDDGIVAGATNTPARAPYPARLGTVKIFNNLIQQTTQTAIHLSNARDNNEIYDNVIIDSGTAIISGVNTNGNIYNNIIDGATKGVRVFGYGVNNVVGNTFKRVNQLVVTGEKGVSVPEATPSLELRIINNTFQSPSSTAIDTSSLALASTITDNLFCDTTLASDTFVTASIGSSVSGNETGSDACNRIKPTPTQLSVSNTAVVTASLLNVRQSASTTAPILQKITRNTVVTVTSRSFDGWTAVRTIEGIQGYVSTTYIQGSTAAASALTSLNVVGKQLRVLPSNLNLRAGPSVTTHILAVLTNKDVVEVYALSPVSQWLLIRTESGKVGYVSQLYVEAVR
ncbi:SH3 domain-containing protein [Candidatus Nomurabacteria bacterium]|nr:SH3 domain-containing protein [Candidatus Nomurabacteria bacterium]